MISLKRNKSYTSTLFIAVIMMSMLFVHSCRTAHRVPDQANIKVSQPWVFSIDFQKAVYKTQMLVYGNELTGLTMIKETGSNYRVVFMSEIGLKYFDLEFSMHGDSVQNHYVINLLDRKQVLEMIETNYNLLFMRFPEKRSEKF